MTSKCHTIDDINSKLNFFGYRGEAIASTVDVSGTVEISSRHRLSQLTYSKIFHNGKAMPVTQSKSHRPSVGTTASVHDFFYNMPVRRRGMSGILELEQVKRSVESIALVNPSVSFSVRNDATGECVLQTHKTNSVVARFGLLFGADKTTGVKDVSLSHAEFELSGFISVDGHHNKSLQFIYVNGRVVKKTQLHTCVNNMLANSLVARRPSRVSESSWQGKEQESGTEVIGHRHAQDIFGIYVLQIKCPRSEYDICLEPAKTLIEFKDWDGILSAIEMLVRDFLVKNNLTLGTVNPSGVIPDPQVGQDSLSPIIDDQEMSAHVPESTADLALEPLIQSRPVKRSQKLSKSLYSQLRPMYTCSAQKEVDDEHSCPIRSKIPKTITEVTAVCNDDGVDGESHLDVIIDHKQSLREGVHVLASSTESTAKDLNVRAPVVMATGDHSESGYQSHGDIEQACTDLSCRTLLIDRNSSELYKYSASVNSSTSEVYTGGTCSQCPSVTDSVEPVMTVEPCNSLQIHSSSSFIKPHSSFPNRSTDASHSSLGHLLESDTLYTPTSYVGSDLSSDSIVGSINASLASAESTLMREKVLTQNSSYRSPLQSSSISSKLSKLFKSNPRRNGLTTDSKMIPVRRLHAVCQPPPPTSVISHHPTALQQERLESIRTENISVDPDEVHFRPPSHKPDYRSLPPVPLTSSAVHTCASNHLHLLRPGHSDNTVCPTSTSDLTLQHSTCMHPPIGTSTASVIQALPLREDGLSSITFDYHNLIPTETTTDTSRIHCASVSGTVLSHPRLALTAQNGCNDQLLESPPNCLHLPDLCSSEQPQCEDELDLSNSGFSDKIGMALKDTSSPNAHSLHYPSVTSLSSATMLAMTDSHEPVWKQVVDPATGGTLYMHSKSGNCVSSLPHDSSGDNQFDSFSNLFSNSDPCDSLDSGIGNSTLPTDCSSTLASTDESSMCMDMELPRGASALHPHYQLAKTGPQFKRQRISISREDSTSSTPSSLMSSALSTSSLIATYKPQLELFNTKWRYQNELNEVSTIHHGEMTTRQSFSDIFKGWKNPTFQGGDEVSCVYCMLASLPQCMLKL